MINSISSPSPVWTVRQGTAWKFQLSNHALVFLATSLKFSRSISHLLSIQKMLWSPQRFQTLGVVCQEPGTKAKYLFPTVPQNPRFISGMYISLTFFYSKGLKKNSPLGRIFKKIGNLFWGIPSWLCLVTSPRYWDRVSLSFHCPVPHSGPPPSLSAGMGFPSSEVFIGPQRAGGSIMGFYTVVLGTGPSNVYPASSKQVNTFVSHSPEKSRVLLVLQYVPGLY